MTRSDQSRGGFRARWPTPGEFVAVGLVYTLLAVCLWPVLRNGRTPTGDPIPHQYPDEANRFFHPDGFSIIVPPRWNAVDRGSLEMAPISPGPIARRSKALLSVTCVGRDTPADWESFGRVSFQQQEAYERMKIVRKSTFDDPPWSEYDMFIHHEDNWYHVRYGIAEARTMLPPEVRQYVSTLRWENKVDRVKK